MAALDKAIHIDDLPRDNDTTAPEDWLTIDETASELGMSPKTLRDEMARKEGSGRPPAKWFLQPAHKDKQNSKFTREQVEQMKAARKRKGKGKEEATDSDNTGFLFDTTKENAPTAESEGAEVTQPDNSPHSNTVSHATGSAWPTFSLFAHTLTTTAERAITYPELVAMAAKPCEVEKDEAKAFTTGNATQKTGEAVKADGVGFAVAVIDIDNSTALAEIESGLQEMGIGRALIYSTKNATATIKKWRVVVPFSEPLDRDTWHSITSLLCERFAGDKAMLSPTQVSFVPNEGSFYHHQELTTGEPLNRQSPVVARAIDRKRERLIELEREKAAMAKAHSRESKRAQQNQSLANGKSPIDAFNAQFSIASLLEPHGYKRHRGKKYLCPNSTSGVAGVVILDDPTTGKERVYSHHGPDSDPLANGFAHDAFSVFTVLEHGGNFDAALKAAGEITGVTKANQEAYRQQLHQQHLEREKQERLNDFAQVQDVSQAGGQQGQDGGHGQQQEFKFVSIGNLIAERKPAEYVIDELIEHPSMALIYGAHSSGKSFVSLSMAACVATGTQWMGRDVKQGAVFYLAGEGHAGIGRRLLAWSLHNKVSLDQAPIYISQTPANLMDEPAKVLVAIQQMQSSLDVEPALIVIDTLARNMGGGDENSNSDMGKFIAGVDAIRTHTKATILLVHHTGHSEDSKHRARGASSLEAAMDFAFLATKDSDAIKFTQRKCKDGEPAKPMQFSLLHPIELPDWFDSKGREMTSAVLVPSDVLMIEEPPKIGKNDEVALQIIFDSWNGGDEVIMETQDLKDEFFELMKSNGDSNPSRSFGRVCKSLAKLGVEIGDLNTRLKDAYNPKWIKFKEK